MNISKLLLVLCAFALSFTACQKETSLETLNSTPGGGASNGAELGTWKFISARSIMDATMEGDVGGFMLKSVSTADVTSIRNSGSVVFDGKTMAFKSVAFSYDGMIHTDIYIDGQKFSGQDDPFQQDYPASQETFDYKKVGADSLYFANGITSGAGPAGTTSGPGGGKLEWDGDKMLLSIPAEFAYTDITGGDPMAVHTKSTVIITLQKP